MERCDFREETYDFWSKKGHSVESENGTRVKGRGRDILLLTNIKEDGVFCDETQMAVPGS